MATGGVWRVPYWSNMDTVELAVLQRIAQALERIAERLETITADPHGEKPGFVRTSDIDRAKVYSTHLGEKLRT